MNDEQLLRYSRHILLDEIGIEGQNRIISAHALIIGAGGLGSPAALYLASAGVGRITLADGESATLMMREARSANAIAGVEVEDSLPLVLSIGEHLLHFHEVSVNDLLARRAGGHQLVELADFLLQRFRFFLKLKNILTGETAKLHGQHVVRLRLVHLEMSHETGTRCGSIRSSDLMRIPSARR